jgi:hypothetical protein
MSLLKCCLSPVNLYWVPYFQGIKIGEVTRQGLKNFSIAIAKKHPNLSSLTLRQIMLVGVTALRWAFANELIQAGPSIGLTGYSTKPKNVRFFLLKRRKICSNWSGKTSGLC